MLMESLWKRKPVEKEQEAWLGAFQRKNKERMQTLLLEGDVNVLLSTTTARGRKEVNVAQLALAARSGEWLLDILRTFLHHVDPRTRHARDLLVLAVHVADVAAVRVLLDMGVARTARKDEDGSTTVMLAAAHERNDGGILSMLLEAGADPHLCSVSGRTPLMMAAGAGSEASTRLLLDTGVDVNETTSRGKTALYEAVARGAQGVVRMLVSVDGINVNAAADGFTPLMAAAGCGNLELVDMLLSAGADYDLRDHTGRTAYDVAVANMHMEVADRLHYVKNVAPLVMVFLGTRQADHDTPLTRAARHALYDINVFGMVAGLLTGRDAPFLV